MPHPPLPGTVSLVVAISGHRDLCPPDIPAIEKRICEIFERLHKKYHPTPLLLLSGLAEGADRAAVRAANKCRVPYIAVLPMPVEYYREDFADPESCDEFERMAKVGTGGALRCITLPLLNASFPAVADPQQERDLQYEKLGWFLVNYSQILIAVWDKEHTGLKGGTSDVVAMELGEPRPNAEITAHRINARGAGPVYEIAARRFGSKSDIAPGDSHPVTYPDGTSEAAYHAIYTLLKRYNSDVTEHHSELKKAAAQSRKDLFEGAEPRGLTSPMEWAAEVYGWADALAVYFSKKSLRLWQFVFAFLAAGGLALTWLHTLSDNWIMLGAYYVCLGLALLIAWRERKDGQRNRHEDYRALAEALRVQFFWIVSGLPALTADHYLPKQAGEMAWIRDAMTECGLHEDVLDRSTGGATGGAFRLGLARKWVQGQMRFFFDTSLRHNARQKGFNIFALSAAGLGVIAPLAGMLLQHCGDCALSGLKPYINAIAGIAMWWAALAWNYSERRGFKQEASRYAQMYELFAAADIALRKCEQANTEESLKDAYKIVLDLGKEALSENGDWLAMHRDRKLTPGLIAG